MWILSFVNAHLYAQSPIKVLLQKVETNYPAIQAKKFRSQAAKEGINLPKNEFLPSIEAAYQLNYATYNNITGMASPLGWIPISGPPSPDNQFGGTFGSALGVVAHWQPITFGQRKVQINQAESEYNLAVADEQNAIYLHQAKVINAYLAYMLARSLIGINQENINRLSSQLTQARTLTITGLRPGVDTALVQSELSKAKIALLQAQNSVQYNEIQVSELVAEQTLSLPYDSIYFNKTPTLPFVNGYRANPALALSQQEITRSESQKKVFQIQWHPKLDFWGTLYARGSGVDYLGNVNSAEGLGFSRFNYGFGVQVSMPILSFLRINIQVKQQDYLIQAAQSNWVQTELQLSAELRTAKVLFANAQSIAQEMPLQLQSAQYAFEAMQSRYDAGLVNYTDLLQIQYNLTEAEIDSQKARFDVWKALLYQSTVAGDLDLFLNQY